ncbi:MAG: beta-hydroxyacyl-ACP dehydratase [Clostridia bacterium]|nr:beta-hydroxyacyl-ACP dehydratase [Clostridia bacterium]
MTRDELLSILPHRDNMLLIDSVEHIGDTAIGSLYIRGDEWFLKGHFPNHPIVPGVILCEILAQSACILLKDVMTKEKLPMYTGLNNVRFKSPVVPGDIFKTKCSITRAKPPFYYAKGRGYVGDRLCVEAEFSFVIMEREACFQRY